MWKTYDEYIRYEVALRNFIWYQKEGSIKNANNFINGKSYSSTTLYKDDIAWYT